MSTPLTATARITTRYVVRGFVHRLVNYVAYNLVLGIPQLVDRDGITTILWTLAAQYQWDKLRQVYSSIDAPDVPSVELEARSGSLWNPVAFAVLTGVGAIGAVCSLAQQTTYVLRDSAFAKLRYTFFEANLIYLYHSPIGASAYAPIQAISDMLNGTDASANAPYRWIKSRGDRFLLATGDIAGATFDLNDKLKRARNLE